MPRIDPTCIEKAGKHPLLSLRQGAREVILESLRALECVSATFEAHFSSWTAKKISPLKKSTGDNFKGRSITLSQKEFFDSAHRSLQVPNASKLFVQDIEI